MKDAVATAGNGRADGAYSRVLLAVGMTLVVFCGIADAAMADPGREIHPLTFWHISDAGIEAPGEGTDQSAPPPVERKPGIERPVVDLRLLDEGSTWRLIGLSLGYVLVLVGAVHWMRYVPADRARRLYKFDAGEFATPEHSNPLVTEPDSQANGRSRLSSFTSDERRRRVTAAEEWGLGYSSLAAWWMTVEVLVFVALLVEVYGALPYRPTAQALIGAIYVIRIAIWCALIGFASWIWIRPSFARGLTQAVLAEPAKGEQLHGTALAFSGGGIRSAAFCLGAIDALQENASAGWQWDDVTAVCAVSGGAYAAGALASHGVDPVVGATEDGPGDQAPAASPDQCLRLGRPGLVHIRNRSNYLAPGPTGMVRAFNDWGSGALVTIALYAATVFIAGSVLGFLAALLVDDPRRFHLGVGALAVALAGGFGVLQTIISHSIDDVDRSRAAQRSGELFGWIWGVVAVLVFVVPTFLLVVGSLEDWATWGRISAALGAGLTAVGLAVAAAWSLVKQAGAPVATYLAGLIVPILTAIGLSSVAYWGVTLNPLHEAPVPTPFVVSLVIAVVLFVAIAALDVVKVSLYPFYRRQLNMAFSTRHVAVGRSEAGGGGGRCEPFQPWHPTLRQLQKSGGTRTTVICAAANVMSSPITPPGRGSLSFTFSDGFVGLPGEHEPGNKIQLDGLRGYDARGVSKKERDAEGRRQEDFSLFSAVAISGAALAPGMGKLTRRSFEALLAVFNIRLGVWLPNPAYGERDRTADAPRRPHMFPYFFKELFGLHNILDPYLYISDGGHWDNLALVEALRLRPKLIIVFDSSGDPPGTFATLGEAISLAESELPVRIHLDTTPLTNAAPSKERRLLTRPGGPRPRLCVSRCFTEGEAEWRTLDGAADTTTIIYCRATVTSDAPVSIRAFQAKHPKFPNHSTFRQLFDDQTFEAYRALGYFSAESIRSHLGVHDTFQRAEELVDLRKRRTAHGVGLEPPISSSDRRGTN